MLIFVTRLLVMFLGLKFVIPEPNQVFNVGSSEKLKFLKRIRLGLSHLVDHKLRRNFQDYVNLICSCGLEMEASNHHLSFCSNYHGSGINLFEKVNKIDSTTLKQNDQVITKLLPFGNKS